MGAWGDTDVGNTSSPSNSKRTRRGLLPLFELDDRRSGSGKDERYDLPITGAINGDELAHANLKDLYFTFPQMIERASQHVRLRPGDIIGSGTVGTGCILELGTERHRWLQPGDVCEMSVERLGALRNRIVESPTR